MIGVRPVVFCIVLQFSNTPAKCSTGSLAKITQNHKANYVCLTGEEMN